VENFLENLKLACATQRSISHICRQVAINRQQFNRYINGDTQPSAYNLARIAGYFGLAAGDFSLPPAIFRQRLQILEPPVAVRAGLLEGFPGDIEALRRHTGYFQTYHRSPSWPDLVICSLSRIYEEHGEMRVKSMERIRDSDSEIRQDSKYTGLAAFWRNRIFITERSLGVNPMLSQTILIPFEAAHQRVYLRGVTLGVAWRQGNLPYASRMIWRHLGPKPNLRATLSRCGVLPLNARQLPPTVRSFLDGPPAELLTVPTEY